MGTRAAVGCGGVAVGALQQVSYKYESLTMDELETKLRRVGAVWFRNDDLLLLEELLRRTRQLEKRNDQSIQQS